MQRGGFAWLFGAPGGGAPCRFWRPEGLGSSMSAQRLGGRMQLRSWRCSRPEPLVAAGALTLCPQPLERRRPMRHAGACTMRAARQHNCWIFQCGGPGWAPSDLLSPLSTASACPVDSAAGARRLRLIPGLERNCHAALSFSLALRSSSLPLLHRSSHAHSSEPRFAGGRRHSLMVVRQPLGSLQLAMDVRLEACWSLWGWRR